MFFVLVSRFTLSFNPRLHFVRDSKHLRSEEKASHSSDLNCFWQKHEGLTPVTLNRLLQKLPQAAPSSVKVQTISFSTTDTRKRVYP
jgi:hypothetical protein